MVTLLFVAYQKKNNYSANLQIFPVCLYERYPKHDVNTYLNLLRHDGSLILVGLPPEPLEIGAFNVVMGRRSFAGSNIGGIAETQEMLDFCSKHNIVAEIERISIQDVNHAFERLEKGDVKYRFVIDMSSLKK